MWSSRWTRPRSEPRWCARGPWARLDVVERIGSTNAALLAAAAHGAPDRTVSSPSTRTRGAAGWAAAGCRRPAPG